MHTDITNTVVNYPFDEQQHLHKFHNLFTCLDGIFVMLDMKKGCASWVSSKLKKCYPQLVEGTEYDQVIKDIGREQDNIDLINMKIESCLADEDNICNINFRQLNISICNVGHYSIVIRLQEDISSTEAQGRYLKDRESLLFTSRSITVSEMASTLAHEINQPVGTIHNLLHGVRARLVSLDNIENDIIRAIESSIEQTEYTADIIARIRDYTQSRKPTSKKIEVKGLLEKCVSLLDWETRHENVDIRLYKNNNTAIISGDEIMLQQVIVNLIRNGMEASEGLNKIISITTAISDTKIEILIKDNGKGMTDQETNSIFIPFASTKSTGMGIGLNICRSFIELHRGKLWLTRNEDRGCTSHIMLPIQL